MFDAAIDGVFKGLYVQGEDILQSDPNTHHVAAALAAMECVVVQDLFLNETANYAHVFLPGSTFLEKDGTFTNAERRIQLVRKVMAPKNGYADWEVTQLLSQRHGLSDGLHPSVRRSWTRSRALTPTFAGVSFEQLDETGLGAVAVQRRSRPRARRSCTIGGFVRGKGQFMLTEYVPTDEKVGPRFPLLLTTGRILSQYNVGAQTRRTDNVASGTRRTCWRSIRTTPRSAASATATGSSCRAGRARQPCAARITDRVAPGVVYTTFHHPETQANVVTTDYSDWATNCPEYKVTAVQVAPSNGPTDWQAAYDAVRATAAGSPWSRPNDARRPSTRWCTAPTRRLNISKASPAATRQARRAITCASTGTRGCAARSMPILTPAAKASGPWRPRRSGGCGKPIRRSRRPDAFDLTNSA